MHRFTLASQSQNILDSEPKVGESNIAEAEADEGDRSNSGLYGEDRSLNIRFLLMDVALICFDLKSTRIRVLHSEYVLCRTLCVCV